MLSPPIVIGGDSGDYLSPGEAMLFSTGRYLDRIMDADGELKFAERIVVFDSKRIVTFLFFEFGWRES